MLKTCAKFFILSLVFVLGLITLSHRAVVIAQFAPETDETKPTDTSKTLPKGCYYQDIQCFAEPCEPIVVCPNQETPPAGCHYESVQCFQAPCDPILVCASPTLSPNTSPASSPSSSPTSSPTASPDTTDDTPPYCYYKQVQCLVAPCEPIWVCEDTPPSDLSQQSCPGNPDQNGDSLINLFDYTAFINVLKGTVTLGKAKADINCDGRVNILDYTLFINAFQNAE
jgi:hypothetical protein